MIEHLVIAIKVVVALVIPDVPSAVVEAEKRRVKLVKQARKEMRYMKKMGNFESMEDI